MMVRIREHVSVIVVLASLLLLPAVTRAQTGGGIAGAVRDTSGAVMPGVTVEAASPALIEQVRAVVTDEAGQYKIVDLRPGLYSVTFSLPGFKTIKRDAIGLTTGFTATVNADMEVGALEETITVTGASPIVDTQNVRTQAVLSHEYLETVPTGKTFPGFASLILGAAAGAGPDVGGSRGEFSSTVTIHGSRGGDFQMKVDGMPYTYMGNTGGGSSKAYVVNQLAAQEMVLETSGTGAETENGGVQQNVVPKDGGNIFSLSALGNYTGQDLGTDNLTDTLRARGLTATNSVRRIYDGGVGLGGPFKKDTLWFYTAHRWWGASEYPAGSYFNKTQDTLFYTPDLSRPGYSGTPNRDNSIRLTWQAAQKHKLTVSESFQRNCYCTNGTNANVAPEATNEIWFSPTSLTQATWTYPATNRLLFQVGATYGHNYWFNVGPDGVTPDSIAVTELSTGLRYGAKAGLSRTDYGWVKTHQINTRASGSYITGSHAFKTGFFLQAGAPAADEHENTVNQSVSYAFRKPTPDAAPVPVSVTQWASPNYIKVNARNAGLYAQDQWTLQRLTLNLGVRFDYLYGWVPAQTRPGGRFVPEVRFEKVDNLPDWKDVAPRLGAAYDLFGNGKTAIRAALGRYVVGEAGNLTALASPSAALVLSATRVWNDANRDYVPQDSELGPLSNSAFGTVRQNTRWADEFLVGTGVRHFDWQGSASLQQELRPGLGLTVGYFRTAYGNFTVTDNLNVTPADYSPFCVTAPVDPRLPGGGGNQICGQYDIVPTAFGAVNNLVVPASAFGKQTEVFNGVEVGLSARFGRGGLLNGGVATGRTVTNRCFVMDSPQQLYQCEVSTPDTQFKVNGAYPLPWDLQVSWTYQNVHGKPILANLVYTNAQIAPSLGRNLGSCGTRVPCNGTATVSLIEPGTQFEGRYTQLDLRLTKTIRLGRARLQGMADAYNVLNAETITSRNDNYGPTWGQPTIQLGRLFKFGTQIDW